MPGGAWSQGSDFESQRASATWQTSSWAFRKHFRHRVPCESCQHDFFLRLAEMFFVNRNETALHSHQLIVIFCFAKLSLDWLSSEGMWIGRRPAMVPMSGASLSAHERSSSSAWFLHRCGKKDWISRNAFWTSVSPLIVMHGAVMDILLRFFSANMCKSLNKRLTLQCLPCLSCLHLILFDVPFARQSGIRITTNTRLYNFKTGLLVSGEELLGLHLAGQYLWNSGICSGIWKWPKNWHRGLRWFVCVCVL